MPPCLTPPLFHVEAAPELATWLRAYLAGERLVLQGERILVAVSGGPDSVALLHLLARLAPQIPIQLGVAHFDHRLRGETSRQDARFVAHLAEDLGLPCHQGGAPVGDYARERKISLQMAARELRRAFLRETCRQHGYDKTALGHTADDQVELFFLRLLRGAGLSGLKGMWPGSPEGLIRPLLAVGKEVLLAWLTREGLHFREDQSNLSRRYLRNRLRLDLLPELARSYNPRVKEAVWRLMNLLQEDERLLQEETCRVWPQVVTQPAPLLAALKLTALLALAPALKARLLQAAVARVGGPSLTAGQVDNLLALAQGRQSGGALSLAGCTVARAGSELHVFRTLPPAPPAGAFLNGPGTAQLPPGWRLTVSPAPRSAASMAPAPHRVFLDAAQVCFPLELRPPRPGDRFWPAGAPGAKKLKDFLVDGKIPRWLRPHLPLVACRGQILWVAGLRAAHPVRVTPASEEILELQLRPETNVARRIWQYLAAYTPRRPAPGNKFASVSQAEAERGF